MTIKNKITYSAIAMGIGIFAMLFISSSSISELNDSAKDIETIGTKLTQNQTIIAKHERFMGEMCRAMVNNKQFGGGTDATQCVLGKWWYSFKKEEEYNKLPQSLKTKFKAMEISHVKIHAIARDYKLAGKNERTIKNIIITAPNEFENIISALEGYSEYLLKNKKEITTHNEELVNMVDTQLIILAVILIVLFIISLIVNRNIISDLKQLENATLGLKNTGSSSSRIEINKDDEISVISQNINDYLNGIEKGIKEDARFIEDTQRVMNRVENGWFSQHIEADTKNPSLIKLKDTVNHALQNLKDRFFSMNTILEQYVNLDYRNKLNLTGIEKDGVFDTLIYDINKLRQAINDMLVENKENGLTLDKSSDILLKNVDTLNRNSNSAAAALEETAAALEEITSNIATNTDNVVRMSGFTNKLTSSATEGLTLAKQTTTAMNEIDNQVQSINEAITVIDKIAFQTNILSLNAAVEAATAGEAGKGFAVVAQEVRNLAARSAEAANEIKALVETATNKANEGKNISDRMIEGYNRLNNNITNTIDLIRDIESASKEQQQGIEQINDAVTSLDQQTQQIATIASQTHSVAVQTDSIAKLIVKNANEKEFVGKESVKAKEIDSSQK